MATYRYAILALGWVIWVLPFFVTKRISAAAEIVDRRARWGVVIMAVAFSILWQGKFWEASTTVWRVAASVCLLLLAGLLSWTGALALGRHWRIDAGLNSDHELVTSGPYRVVRHPIYTSMLCLLLGTGFMISLLPLLALSVVVFIAGIEIRVRIEDRLLASRFGDGFSDYQRRVPAYIPFVR